jgi:CDP-diacylglycerol--glycerol-3-phosphate 3-phosphatidyltransferase
VATLSDVSSRSSSRRPTDDDLRERWAARHPGYDVGKGLLSRWLRVMWWLARPLVAARVPPDVVTVAGGVLAVAAAGSRPGRASTLLIASAVADGLDGAVAIVTDTSTAHGTMLDHACDRVGDVAAGIVLCRAGGPRVLVGSALVLSLAQETWLRRTPVLTANERPTRIVCAAVGDVGRRVTGRRWPAIIAALVWDGLAAIATLRLAGRRSDGVRGQRS